MCCSAYAQEGESQPPKDEDRPVTAPPPLGVPLFFRPSSGPQDLVYRGAQFAAERAAFDYLWRDISSDGQGLRPVNEGNALVNRSVPRSSDRPSIPLSQLEHNADIKKRLAMLGYLDGASVNDGLVSEAVLSAVRKFQQRIGASVTGYLNKDQVELIVFRTGVAGDPFNVIGR